MSSMKLFYIILFIGPVLLPQEFIWFSEIDTIMLCISRMRSKHSLHLTAVSCTVRQNLYSSGVFSATEMICVSSMLQTVLAVDWHLWAVAVSRKDRTNSILCRNTSPGKDA